MLVKEKHWLVRIELLKVFPGENEKLEETLTNYISENDLKLLKTEIPDKGNFSSKKQAYPHE